MAKRLSVRPSRNGSKAKGRRAGAMQTNDSRHRLYVHIRFENQCKNIEPESIIRHAGTFPMAEMVLWGILPASARILLLATPRRGPLRLRLSQKHAAWHKRAISPEA